MGEERATHMSLGQLARRRQQAEAELGALQAAADGVSDKVGMGCVCACVFIHWWYYFFFWSPPVSIDSPRSQSQTHLPIHYDAF